MEPIFTLSYPEFCVAQHLGRLLRAKRGYSIYVPLSRQEKGVDLLITQRRSGKTRSAAIQVKSSRTYSHKPPTRWTKRQFLYYTWFNNFEVPVQADFFFLIALYPAEEARASRIKASWWAPVILVFSQKEMRSFLRSVKTKQGKRNPMFGFGFDNGEEVRQTRGDPYGRFKNLSAHLLHRRISSIKGFLKRR